ncbi:MAG: hypothetical protein K0Q76_2192 [Panacagrimonas sp.]|jgi:hypothetical protein|nr:hypothetical protein [Panacagrimonas sp.]MCC2657084.1 hypothetical protein [Panacagrimonas sp.]
MDFNSPWLIEPFGDKGSVRATHTSGVQILLSANGWATVLNRPDEVSESEAQRLKIEAMEWVEVRH